MAVYCLARIKGSYKRAAVIYRFLLIPRRESGSRQISCVSSCTRVRRDLGWGMRRERERQSCEVVMRYAYKYKRSHSLALSRCDTRSTWRLLIERASIHARKSRPTLSRVFCNAFDVYCVRVRGVRACVLACCTSDNESETRGGKKRTRERAALSRPAPSRCSNRLCSEISVRKRIYI